jgi:hypothetical protein
MKTGEVWRLYRGEELVSELTVTEIDFPWLHARFMARPAFEPLTALFAEELALVDDDETDCWDAAYDRIRSVVRLTYPDGRDVPEFLLHIEGDVAWWRWSDEPFEQS